MQKNTCGRWWVKVDYYKGEDLRGDWMVTYKIDGVRLLRGKDGKVYTRNGIHIDNADKLPVTDCEYYAGSWSESGKMIVFVVIVIGFLLLIQD